MSNEQLKQDFMAVIQDWEQSDLVALLTDMIVANHVPQEQMQTVVDRQREWEQQNK